MIAIIAILAAILFPVFMSARESGRITRCVANLKNIGQALGTYRDNYDGRNCHIWQHYGQGHQQDPNKRGDYDDYGSFFWVIERYVGQTLNYALQGKGNEARRNVYRCPSARWLAQEWGVFGERSNKGFAYTMNETGWNDPDLLEEERIHAAGGLEDCQFRRPSQIIFVAEGMGWVSYGVGYGYGDGKVIDNENPSGGNTDGDGWTSRNPPADEVIPLSEAGYLGRHHGSRSMIYNLRVSHNMGANCMFYDGHIKLLKTTKGRNWSVVY